MLVKGWSDKGWAQGMVRLILAIVAGCWVSAAFAAQKQPYETGLEQAAGISKSPAAHLPDICHKDHEGLDLAAAEPVADAETRLNAAIGDGGELIAADIDGLGCAYCAAAIEKAFSARAEIAAAYVNPRNSTLSIVTVKGQAVDDALIRKLIRRRGYDVSAIRRGEFARSVSTVEPVETADPTTPQ